MLLNIIADVRSFQDLDAATLRAIEDKHILGLLNKLYAPNFLIQPEEELKKTNFFHYFNICHTATLQMSNSKASIARKSEIEKNFNDECAEIISDLRNALINSRSSINTKRHEELVQTSKVEKVHSLMDESLISKATCSSSSSHAPQKQKRGRYTKSKNTALAVDDDSDEEPEGYSADRKRQITMAEGLVNIGMAAEAEKTKQIQEVQKTERLKLLIDARSRGLDIYRH